MLNLESPPPPCPMEGPSCHLPHTCLVQENSTVVSWGRDLGQRRVSQVLPHKGHSTVDRSESHHHYSSCSNLASFLQLHYSFTRWEDLGLPKLPSEKWKKIVVVAMWSQHRPLTVKCLSRSLFQRPVNRADITKAECVLLSIQCHTCPSHSCPRTFAHALSSAWDAHLLTLIELTWVHQLEAHPPSLQRSLLCPISAPFHPQRNRLPISL